MWQVTGRSVCGASHRRRHAPNQDAIRWTPESGTGPCVAIAVADGHGSAASFRSAFGSELAVETALQVLQEFEPEREREDWLAQEMTRRWREAVAQHLEQNPWTDREEQKRKPDPAIAYGSTILSVLATEQYILYTQLGDGDILIVSEEGGVTRPWPRDERLLGVETTSLCLQHAASEVRVSLQSICECAPELVLLSTDGYANSFREDAGFLKIGRDILEIIQQEGMEKVEANLQEWLWEASQLGSGDDITLGLLSRER